MAVFEKEEFSNLTFDIYERPEVILHVDYKRKFINCFGPATDYRRIDLDKLIRYVIFMYDKKSPMREMFPEITTRKKESATLAGYDLKLDRLTLEKVFNFTDKHISTIVSVFLKFQNHRVWGMLVTDEEMFWSFQRQIMEDLTEFANDKQKVDGSIVKSKLSAECAVIHGRIKAMEEEIFGNEEGLRDKLSKPVTPEEIANSI